MTAVPPLPRLTNRALAELVGCDAKTITNLRRKGMPDPKAEPALAIKWYCVHIDTGRVVDPKSRARIEAARADLLELQAYEQRGRVLPVEMVEEQVATMFGLFIQELEGAEARLQRSAPSLSATVRTEVIAMRDNLAKRMERYIESLEERARRAGGGTP